MFPKPGKKRKPGIVIRAGREICRTKYQWDKRRKEVFEREKGLCQKCGRFAPLHDEMDPNTGEVRRRAGHAHHIANRKMGGGFRDDRADKLLWHCWECHDEDHRPQKVVPRKG